MELVRAKGMYSFYEDGHQECCRVRKVGGRRSAEGGAGVVSCGREGGSPRGVVLGRTRSAQQQQGWLQWLCTATAAATADWLHALGLAPAS